MTKVIMHGCNGKMGQKHGEGYCHIRKRSKKRKDKDERMG